MAINLFNSEVIANEKLNYKFHLIKFRLRKSNEVFSFQEGQFVVILVGSSVYRSYSIASKAEELPEWRLLVDITPGGPGSTFLKNLKVGQKIQHSSGKGAFTLNKKPSPLNIMIATGCGIASLIPMTEKLLQQRNKKTVLFWGLRFKKDICMFEWLNSFSSNASFNHQIILSKPSKDWNGAKGYVTDLLADLIKSISLKDLDIYICGNKLMINDVKSLLQTIDFAEERMHFERHY